MLLFLLTPMNYEIPRPFLPATYTPFYHFLL